MSYEQCTLDQVVDALRFVSADVPRDDWAKIAMAIKSEFPDALDVFDDWSSSAKNYNKNAVKNTWSSVSAYGGIGIGTLFAAAIAGGYTFERRELTEQEKADQERDRAQRMVLRAELAAKEKSETEAWHVRVAEMAQQAWGLLSDVGFCSYLAAKGVRAYGVRFSERSVLLVFRDTPEASEVISGSDAISAYFKNRNEDDSIAFLKKGCMAVPMYDENFQIVNLQVIFTGGGKMFLKHGRVAGTFGLLGDVAFSDDDAPLAIAEGYATGASAIMATGWQTVLCWSCGNMERVASFFRQRFSSRRIILIADDDAKTAGNPGLTAARTASDKLGCGLAVPQFFREAV